MPVVVSVAPVRVWALLPALTAMALRKLLPSEAEEAALTTTGHRRPRPLEEEAVGEAASMITVRRKLRPSTPMDPLRHPRSGNSNCQDTTSKRDSSCLDITKAGSKEGSLLATIRTAEDRGWQVTISKGDSNFLAIDNKVGSKVDSWLATISKVGSKAVN
jgi:hypothetical protein